MKKLLIVIGLVIGGCENPYPYSDFYNNSESICNKYDGMYYRGLCLDKSTFNARWWNEMHYLLNDQK